MMRTIGASALAIGAVLSLNGIASAGDDNPTKSSFGTTMTLGGQGTAAQAAAADDTELTHGYRGGYYGGYRGGYYGGYRGGYYGGFRGGYYGGYRGGYYGGYRPYYGFVGHRPYYGGYYGYRPYVQPYFSVGYGFGGYSGYNGYYCGISGTNADADAPVVSLNMAVTKDPLVVTPASGFQYDGDRGTVPLPTVKPQDQAAPQPTGLPVSLQRTKPTNPYTFKAYGET